MMRKSLWIVPFLLLFAAIGSTTARADSFDYYSISFSGADAPTAAAGTVLTYDATTQLFTTPSFALTFEGNVYTMDIAIDPSASNPPTSDSLEFEDKGIGSAIVIDDETTFQGLYDATTSSTTAPGTIVTATLTAVASPVPELNPSSGTSVLVLLAGAVLIIRSRRTKIQPENV